MKEELEGMKNTPSAPIVDFQSDSSNNSAENNPLEKLCSCAPETKTFNETICKRHSVSPPEYVVGGHGC